MTPAHGMPGDPRVPPHMMQPLDPGGFSPAEFGMPPTRPGIRRGIPRPPMPAERTELVRIGRPSYVRAAAVSATLGALLGLGAGYLLWGMDPPAFRGGSRDDPAAGRPTASRPVDERPIDERPAAAPVDAPDAGATDLASGEPDATAKPGRPR
jgi:hypothetical protein